MVLLDDDAKIGLLKSLTDAVHEAGVPIIAQIAHCGRNSVSGRKFDVNKMSDAELEKMITDFIAAAVRTQKAGFDGVQVHFYAHGHFSGVSSCLRRQITARINGAGVKKKDSIWGERIISGIKKELPDYPILCKDPWRGRRRNRIHADEAARVAVRMEEAGVSAKRSPRGLSVMNNGMGPVVWTGSCGNDPESISADDGTARFCKEGNEADAPENDEDGRACTAQIQCGCGKEDQGSRPYPGHCCRRYSMTSAR